MKENFEQMKERHEKEIKELQDNCKHEKISEWMPYMYAPGHYAGEVRCCDFCSKIIEKRPDKIHHAARSEGEYPAVEPDGFKEYF